MDTPLLTAELVVDGAYSIMPPYLAVRAAHERANAGHGAARQ